MATETDGAAGAESAGMPQLDFATFDTQIFWLVLALLALYYIVANIAIPRIGAVIEERSDAIANDLERAAEFKRRAEEAEQAYEKALADARAEAQRIAGETRAQIQEEVAAAQAKADAEIAAKASESEARINEIRDGAAAAVEEVATEAAAAIVETILPGGADADAVKAAVAARTAR